MVVRLDRSRTGRLLNLGEVRKFLFCFAFLASTPGVRLAWMTITSTPRSVNGGGALDIQSPGRPRGTTASEGYGVSVLQLFM